MKRVSSLALAAIALSVHGHSFAQQDQGRVLSSTPVLQQVAVPRQVCTIEQVAVQPQKSGAGAVMGAVAGGAVGNAVGRGAGQAAATVIGVLGGAVLGDRIEGAPPVQMQNVQRCANQTFYESRTAGYNVVYEYAGKQYTVQMPNEPGPYIALNVTPVGTQAAPPVAAPAVVQAPAPTYYTPAPIYAPAPVVLAPPVVYPPYYARPYYPPVSVNLGWGYWGGHHGHWH
ncbi:glycine zipper 2TM domain-containing protein [Rhodoferax aquaticus]|uniref:Glycine zipper 2TM domain-containing protein n=1 Tax=Rhodoferax aquaticus TaxID=2527691 RepID=A0A515EKN9_9BURK|nr:glycine zipper 2TM domain-containing protein [Rhodoferax aquaticus]QDL53218.1 glycine zipper 2TM domain-containing protein [Rhodoferax aquaticus]